MYRPTILYGQETGHAGGVDLVLRWPAKYGFQFVTKCILLALYNVLQSREGRYDSLDKIVPVSVADECGAGPTRMPLHAPSIRQIAPESLHGSAEIAG